MRLTGFRIENFKSIADTGVCRIAEKDNILVLAGQNEAGKSAVIEAINFFGNGPTENFEKLHRRQDKDPVVTMTFTLSPEDIENIFIETGNEELKGYLLKNSEISLMRCINTDDKFDEVFFTEETEEMLTPFFTKAEDKTKVLEKKDGDNDEPAVEVVPSEELNPKMELNELQKFIIVEMRKFVFYNSFDNQLPSIIAIKDIPTFPAVQDFEKVFRVKFEDIVKKDARGIRRSEMDITDKASDDLNKYWTQKLEEDSHYNFTVKIVKKEPVEESTVEFMIDKVDGDPLYLEQKSNGFRWFSSFNLRLRSLGVEETTIQNLVILIDEPGQGLHEKAQRDLKNVIEELGGKGAQILYTTHYPNLIGTTGKEFVRIRLISNTKTLGTKVETVAQFASRGDVGASDALSPIITAMGIQSVGTLLDKERLNVLVEGITDHYYLCALQKILNKSDRLYFIPACGVSNVPNLASVLIGWGFNYKAVFDDDASSGRKAYALLKKEFYGGDDKLTHEHVFKIPGCDGIEDMFSQNDFFKYILQEEVPSSGSSQKNSSLAKGKKEVLARLFLERVSEPNSELALDKESMKNIDSVFNWLYEKFSL